MTDTVVDTQTVEVTAPHSYVDSEGDGLAVDAFVRTSTHHSARYWDWESNSLKQDRPFDFGVVSALNEDGTVQVLWESAGCGCGDSDDNGRTENSEHLTLSNEGEMDAYYLGHGDGFFEGVESKQNEFRRALGLSDEAVPA